LGQIAVRADRLTHILGQIAVRADRLTHILGQGCALDD
jgi:hypothetical protein